MDCARIRDELSAYLDGELTAAVEGEVRAHIEHCAECREELDSLREMIESVNALPAQKAPKGFRDNVMTLVHEDKKGKSAWRYARYLWPAAAAILVGVAFSLLMPPKVEPHRRSTVGNGVAIDRGRDTGAAWSSGPAEETERVVAMKGSADGAAAGTTLGVNAKDADGLRLNAGDAGTGQSVQTVEPAPAGELKNFGALAKAPAAPPLTASNAREDVEARVLGKAARAERPAKAANEQYQFGAGDAKAPAAPVELQIVAPDPAVARQKAVAMLQERGYIAQAQAQFRSTEQRVQAKAAQAAPEANRPITLVVKASQLAQLREDLGRAGLTEGRAVAQAAPAAIAGQQGVNGTRKLAQGDAPLAAASAPGAPVSADAGTNQAAPEPSQQQQPAQSQLSPDPYLQLKRGQVTAQWQQVPAQQMDAQQQPQSPSGDEPVVVVLRFVAADAQGAAQAAEQTAQPNAAPEVGK